MKIAQMTVAQMTVAQMYTDLRNECRAAQARAAELEADRDFWRVAHADNELYGLELIAQRDAALARVAELEADANDAAIEAQENVIIALGLNPNDYETNLMEHVINGVIAAMRQRVAELEAALAAERAAHAWRPVTTAPPADGEYIELLVIGYCDDGCWYADDDFPVNWRPRQPLPAAPQEPQ